MNVSKLPSNVTNKTEALVYQTRPLKVFGYVKMQCVASGAPHRLTFDTATTEPSLCYHI